jgi:pimeloyl-ACP methyl ester carboxylesterase
MVARTERCPHTLSVGRAVLAIALAALAATMLAAAPAEAALRWEACNGAQCARLSVPLDRSGVVPGSVSLKVERRRARRGPAKGVVLLLGGGPGQSAVSAYRPSFGRPYEEFARVFGRHDVVAFDQRGTGGSGVLRCRDLEWTTGLDPGTATEACAVKLGPRAAHYTTSDSVEDLEAVRLALGGPRVTLIGVSYGTYLAQRYAIRYPANVERMVLDSVVDTTGVDSLYRDTFAATRRVLGRVCARGCPRFARDAGADTAALVARLARGPLRGSVVRPNGRRRPATLTREGLLYAFGSGDVDPFLRADYPGAVESALRGDLAPILRLQRRAGAAEGGGESARDFSTATLAATLCEDTRFPYLRSTPIALREGATLAVMQRLDAGLFAPFDAWTAAHNDLLRFCRTWPTVGPGPRSERSPLPDVPTLLLAGEDDTRTPVETAARVAARLPHATLVRVPRVGHSLLGNSLCADRALAAFARGQRPSRRCRGFDEPAPRVTPLVPRSLREVRPVPGIRGAPGRVLNALLLTFADLGYDFVYSFDEQLLRGGSVRFPGLRGGWLRLTFDGAESLRFRFYRLQYVPGVLISGRLRASERRNAGVFRIGGSAAPKGFLRIRGRFARGRIGGRPVRLRSTEDGFAIAGAAGATGSFRLPPVLHDPVELLQAGRQRWRPLDAGWSRAR